jgi:hypothetical protein
VKINLDETASRWQTTARTFAEEELMPCEIEAEMNEGKLPADTVARHKRLAIELGFSCCLGTTWPGYQCTLLVFSRAASMDVRSLHGRSTATLHSSDERWVAEGMLCDYRK